MATLNPLERKARQSFIKGVVITIIIGLLISGLLVFKIYSLKEAMNKEKAGQVDVYVAVRTIESNEEVTMQDLKKVKANKEVAIASLKPQDLENINSGRVETEEGVQQVPPKATLAKIKIPQKAIVTPAMIQLSDDRLQNDLREAEFTCISLPSNLKDKDTIDVRLRTTDGQEYVVVGKKKVTIPSQPGLTANDCFLSLHEDEIMTLNAAIVESYKMKGAKLYAVKYVEPGMQEKSKPTYLPPADIINMIITDPNVLTEAKSGLNKKYIDGYKTFRENVDNQVKGEPGEVETKVNQGTTEEIKDIQANRKTYLQGVDD